MANCPKNCGQRFTIAGLQTLIRQAGCPENLVALMAAIGMAESSGCTHIIGCISPNEWSVGLWQINTRVHKRYSVEQLKDPQINAQEAVRILKAQGLRAWGAYTDGNYKKYLAASNAAYQGAGSQPLTAGSFSNDQPHESGVNWVVALFGILILGKILRG